MVVWKSGRSYCIVLTFEMFFACCGFYVVKRGQNSMFNASNKREIIAQKSCVF